MDLETLRPLLALAERAAARAGEALAEHRETWTEIEAEEGREVKVAADRRAEAMILETLTQGAPFPVLSEEAGWVGGAERETVWAVDPLDGSVNYIQGYPHCGVSIALVHEGRPVLGVVDLFLLRERFTGVVGAGAWLNGRPIRVSDTVDPNRGVLNTGIPARARVDAESFNAFMGRMLAWRKVRMIGSAAAALAYVAAGRADAYRESGSMLWDVAGGLALVAAAGGAIAMTDAAGGPLALDRPLDVTAGNGRIAL